MMTQIFKAVFKKPPESEDIMFTLVKNDDAVTIRIKNGDVEVATTKHGFKKVAHSLALVLQSFMDQGYTDIDNSVSMRWEVA
jgi:hypothetical protein